jgi:ubiquinone/menaquinone biosynthesis C-methylase UbiE
MSSNFYDDVYYNQSSSVCCRRHKGSINPKDVESDFMKNLFHPKPGTRHLDIGCGTGEYLASIDGKGVDLWGIDISKIATDHAREKVAMPEQIICADADPLPFKDEEFDSITAWGVIEHFRSVDSIIQEIARVLKTEGIVAIMVPNVYYYKFIWDALRKGKGPARHQEIEYLYAFKEWVGFLEKNGLSIVQAKRHNKFNKPKLMWLRNIIPFYLSNHFIFFCKKLQTL